MIREHGSADAALAAEYGTDAVSRRGCADCRRDYPARALVLASVFALTLIAGAAPALAAKISVTAQRRGDTIDVNATALLKADAATAWRVLTDYDHYAEFIPNLRVSRVVARHGSLVTVEQAGDALLLM